MFLLALLVWLVFPQTCTTLSHTTSRPCTALERPAEPSNVLNLKPGNIAAVMALGTPTDRVLFVVVVVLVVVVVVVVVLVVVVVVVVVLVVLVVVVVVLII